MSVTREELYDYVRDCIVINENNKSITKSLLVRDPSLDIEDIIGDIYIQIYKISEKKSINTLYVSKAVNHRLISLINKKNKKQEYFSLNLIEDENIKSIVKELDIQLKPYYIKFTLNIKNSMLGIVPKEGDRHRVKNIYIHKAKCILDYFGVSYDGYTKHGDKSKRLSYLKGLIKNIKIGDNKR